MALFDVLMPVRNGAAFIGRAIQSIQAQTTADWRLLVLDHGSTDDTAAIVARHAQADRRIERRHLPDAVGLSGLLNEGLALVEAPYAMRMDADDECLPERMALTRAAFDAGPDLVVVAGQADTMSESGAPIGRLSVPCDRDQLARAALFRNVVLHPTVCFRSRSLADQGIRYGSSIHHETDAAATICMPSLAEDYLLFGELALDRVVLNLPQTLLRYRLHAGAVSRQKTGDQLAASIKVSRHLAALLSRRHGFEPFDPAPFCSHGQTMTDVGLERQYHGEYDHLCKVLRASGGAWRSGDAELAWRAVFVDRSPLAMAWRAATRWRACQPDDWERRTVVNAVQQRIRRKPAFRVDSL